MSDYSCCFFERNSARRHGGKMEQNVWSTCYRATPLGVVILTKHMHTHATTILNKLQGRNEGRVPHYGCNEPSRGGKRSAESEKGERWKLKCESEGGKKHCCVFGLNFTLLFSLLLSAVLASVPFFCSLPFLLMLLTSHWSSFIWPDSCGRHST